MSKIRRKNENRVFTLNRSFIAPFVNLFSFQVALVTIQLAAIGELDSIETGMLTQPYQ